MPEKDLKPDQPGFYTFRNKYGNMGNLIGGKIDDTVPDDEAAAAKASEANYRAYVTSLLPWKASNEEVINRVLEIAPELKVDEEQRASRREKSEKARQAILKTSLRRAFIMDGRPIQNRLDSSFYYRGSAAEIKEKNDEIQEQLKGTPEERGRMLQERINNIYTLYQRVLNHEVTDDELLENLEQFHILVDLVMNAQNFTEESKPNEITGTPYISFSPELGKILKDMEKNSAEIFRFVNRVRTIANPNYEFLDTERMMELDNDKFSELSEYAQVDSDDVEMADIVEVVGTNRVSKRTAGRDNVMRQIRDDFPEEYEGAKLEFFGSNGIIWNMPYTTDYMKSTIESEVDRGGILVTTPSGKAVCYYLDNNTGKVRESDSSELFSPMATKAADVFTKLKKANEGLFIGSKEYKKALKGMPEVLQNIKDMGNPPDLEKMEQATVKLRELIENGEQYLERKIAGGHVVTARAAMSKRERSRYDAMEQFVSYCKMQIGVYALKKQEMEAEMKATLGGADPVKGVVESDVLDKANSEYGKNILPVNNANNTADELRADIQESLGRMLTEKEYDKDEACITFSNMVLLEVIKKNRCLDEFTGDLAAGDLEKAFAVRPEDAVRSMRENPYVKAVTENMTLKLLQQFVMTGSAKTIADKIIQDAKIYEPENKNRDLQKQNEQKIEMQPDVPKSTI